MSRFTPETIERVREAADIVEIVSAHTDLRRQGERFTGLCPFHEERTPSFSVKPRDGLYYCFGCEAGGDAIRFVQEKEGLAFPDAVETLAERYGVEIERETEDPKAEQARRRRARLGDALGRAAAFYESYLWEAEKADRARHYLLTERGLGEEVLRSFGVGFAPSAWDTIVKRGQISGFSVDELLAAGLVQRSQKTPGGHYDRFRGRITFPVRDHRGRVVGFGARAMGDSKPKYLNSPEGELYRKGRTLYGIDRARGPIARGARAVVVEGYTDVIALHGAGIEEAVAVMGTAITPEQLKLLGGYAEEVVLALDADRAGREAMLRAQRVAGSGRLRLLVAAMPEGEDPAEMMLTEEGSNRLRGLIADAVDLAVFHARAILADSDLSTPAGRDRALDEVAPVLVAMGETITRQELVREVADRLDAPPEMVVSRMRSGAGPRRAPEPRPDAAAAGERAAAERRRREPTQEERREAMMLALCMDAPEAAAPFLERLGADHFTAPILRAVFERIREHPADPLDGLGESDSALINAISRLRAIEHEPANRDDLQFRWMLLERDRLDRVLRHPAGLDPAELVALQKQRGALADAISSVEARSVGGAVPGPAAR